ncbi:MAG: hypothetical protein NZM10_05095, partial [Fimbriimonadales bacterium]|nr:hypothetical protein [Fimbriimonadales bacterium]
MQVHRGRSIPIVLLSGFAAQASQLRFQLSDASFCFFSLAAFLLGALALLFSALALSLGNFVDGGNQLAVLVVQAQPV